MLNVIDILAKFNRYSFGIYVWKKKK